MSVRAAELYSYDAPHGHRIAVTAIEGEPDTAHLTCGLADHGMMTAAVRTGDVPEVARGLLRGLYEAAGLLAPIVLDRVPEDVFAAWIHVRESRYPGTLLIDPKTPLTLDGGLRLAAAIVGAVERAEREPDPAEVDALSRVIRAELVAGPTAAEGAARAILARYTLTERKS